MGLSLSSIERTLDRLPFGVNAVGAGFHFEEGGCFGMALALCRWAETHGKRPRVILSEGDFVHCMAEIDGRAYDHRGAVAAGDADRVLEVADLWPVAERYGHDRESVEGDASLAEEALSAAQRHALTDSSGRRILDPADRFLGWFGDSKVVDDQGRPLVVYHGTNSDIGEFDSARLGTSVSNPTTRFGHYFTESPVDAEDWAERAVQRRRAVAAQNVMPVYLSIKNPKSLSAEDFRYYLKRARESTVDRHRDEWVAKGHDGIITERGGKAWFVAFRPAQIKSIFNCGRWDSESASLTDREDDSPTDRPKGPRC